MRVYEHGFDVFKRYRYVGHAAGGRMSEEADLLARVMLVLWDYREAIPAARDLLDEYEALVMDNDEVIQ